MAPDTIDSGVATCSAPNTKPTSCARPATPCRRPGDADSAYQTIQCWQKAVDTLYVTYAASRAAKSLRDAEEARMLALLQLRSAKAYA